MKKIIRNLVYKIPYIVDKYFGAGGVFKEKPGIIFEIDKITNQLFWTEYEELIKVADEKLRKLSSGETLQEKIPLSKDFIDELTTIINKSTDDGIKKLIRFNPLGYDIAYLFLTKFGDLPHRASQYWHHDSVGDRLKIFIDLGSSARVPTIVDCKFNDYSSKPQMFMEDRLQYRPDEKNILELAPILYKTIAVINTNCMHAGSNGVPNATRSYLCIELSNNLKTLCRGRVGRRFRP